MRSAHSHAEIVMRSRCYPADLTDAHWAGGTAHSVSEVRRSSAYNGRPRRPRRDHLFAPHRLPVASTSQRLPALADRTRLLPRLAYVGSVRARAKDAGMSNSVDTFGPGAVRIWRAERDARKE